MVDEGGVVIVYRQRGVIQSGQKVCPDIADVRRVLVHCFQNVLNVAAIQLEKAGFDYLLRHILAVDADGRRSGTDGIQHDVHDLPEAVFIELRLLTENVVIKILFDNLLILASLIHPVHPIKIDGLIVL